MSCIWTAAAAWLSLIGPKELCLEDRRPGRENIPVRSERLAANMERNVCALLGREELAEMLVQIGWWHLNQPIRSSPPLLAELVGNRDIAPDCEAVVLEMLRLLQICPPHELRKAEAARVICSL
jgi:hypothetical protein